jgi:hypothetical protein
MSVLGLKDELTPGLKKAQRALGVFGKTVDRTGSRSFRAGQQIGTGIKRSVAIAAGAVGALGTLFAVSIQDASDLSETISKVGVVFGSSAAQIYAFGKTSASALGLSENAALSAAATFGNLFVSMGLGKKQSADMSQRLVTLAGDLASFNNIDPTEAAEKLRAGITGESEPLKTLGININETVIKAKALELGLLKTGAAGTKNAKSVNELRLEQAQLSDAQRKASEATKKYGASSVQALKATVAAEKAQAKLKGTVGKSTGPLTAAQKAQAAYALILEQSKTAQGDFARTSGGLANQTRILKANWDNLKTTLATPTLPKIAKIFQRINDLLARQRPFIEKLGDDIANLFSDENIEQGARVLTDMFETAKTLVGPLKDAALVTGQVVKTAVQMFNTLPSELKTLLISGLAINKLTGGLVTNLAGGLISSVLSSFKGVLGVNAAVANINAATVTGGGGLPGTVATGAGLGVAATGAALVAGAAIGGAVGGAAARVATEAIDPALLRAIDDPQHFETLYNRDPRRFNKYGQVVANVAPRTPPRPVPPETLRGYLESGNRAGQPGRGRLGRKGPGPMGPTPDDRSTDAIEKLRTATTRQDDRSYDAIETLRARVTTTGADTRAAVASGSSSIVAAINASAATISSAVHSIPPPVVSSTTINSTLTQQGYYGPSTGSRGGARNSGTSYLGTTVRGGL